MRIAKGPIDVRVTSRPFSQRRETMFPVVMDIVNIDDVYAVSAPAIPRIKAAACPAR